MIDVQTVNIAKYGQQIIEKQVANYTQVIKVFIQTDPYYQNVLIKSVEVTKIKQWRSKSGFVSQSNLRISSNYQNVVSVSETQQIMRQEF